MSDHITWVENDGGRSAAGWHGTGGDCVARAVAIASGLPYQGVYDRLAEGSAKQRRSKHTRKKGRTALHGINVKRKWFRDYMAEIGFEWTATMGIGTGCKVHVRPSELPVEGRYVLSLSKHYAAWIDGELHDLHDCSRQGWRCVYGFWRFTGGHVK